jgi:hypothetical protein
MRTSESVMKITAALLKAARNIKHAEKDANNPHFKNNYASLESCIDATKEELLNADIVIIQSPGPKNLTTRLQHVSGEFFEDTMDLLLVKQDMQGLGGSLTYARRQAIVSFLYMSQSDDDGNQSVGKKPKSPIKVVEKKAVTPNDNLPF